MDPERASVQETYWKYWRLSIGDRSQRSAAEGLYWSWEWVETHVSKNPAGSVALVRCLAESAPGEEALAFLCAGPVEQLLKASTRDAAVRSALGAELRLSGALRRSLRFLLPSVDLPAEFLPFVSNGS